MAQISTIQMRLLSALAGVTGLSATTVQVGRPSHGGRIKAPAAFVALGQIESKVGPDLCTFTRTALWDITVYPAGAVNADDRTANMFAMLDACLAALEADRSLGSNCRDLYAVGTQVDGDELGMNAAPVIMLQVATVQVLDSGEGV